MFNRHGRAKRAMFGGMAAASVVAFATIASAAAPGGRPEGAGPDGAMRGPMDHGRMGCRCERFEARLAKVDRHLSADQVRDIIAGRLASGPEHNLKVGKVAEKDGVIDVQIVTKDGSLVKSMTISAKTGLSPDAGKNCERVAERFQKARERNGAPDANGGPPNGDEHRGMGGPGRGRFGHGGPERGGRGGQMRDGGPHEFLKLGFARNMDPGHDLNLSVAQAKTLAEAGLVFAGNSRLKVGAVKEKDADTIIVDIVTADNSLVARREIDRHTGRAQLGQSAQ